MQKYICRLTALEIPSITAWWSSGCSTWLNIAVFDRVSMNFDYVLVCAHALPFAYKADLQSAVELQNHSMTLEYKMVLPLRVAVVYVRKIMHNFVTKGPLIIFLKTNHSAFSPIVYLYYMPNYSIIYHFFLLSTDLLPLICHILSFHCSFLPFNPCLSACSEIAIVPLFSSFSLSHLHSDTHLPVPVLPLAPVLLSKFSSLSQILPAD